MAAQTYPHRRWPASEMVTPQGLAAAPGRGEGVWGRGVGGGEEVAAVGM